MIGTLRTGSGAGLRLPNVVTIPKATQAQHVRANLKALEVTLDAADLDALDRAFRPPQGRTPLQMT